MTVVNQHAQRGANRHELFSEFVMNSSIPDAQDLRMLIGGKLVSASDGRTLASINPANGRKISDIPDASTADVNEAVAHARAAQQEWSRLDYKDRRSFLLKVCEILRGNSEYFGRLDTLETGNIYSAMRQDAHYGADAIEYLCSIGFELKGESTHLDHNLHYSRREPFGVVLRVLPFNHPIMSSATALAAPLLTGNTVILKPSPHASMSTLALGEMIAPLFPAGVVTVLTGSNDTVAKQLVEHEGIDRISVIGSTEAGRAIMRSAADRLLPLTLELGGKNPMIVLPDADIELAAETAIANMNFGWQSASCGSTSRILAHKSVYGRLRELLAARIDSVNVADPFDPKAEMGAISFQALYDRCLDYIDIGTREGATLVTGGDRPKHPALADGLFMRPALFAEATPDMRIAREEIFGPILTMLEWEDWDGMTNVANELPLALTAVIMGNDFNGITRTAHALQAGYIEVNGPVSWALGSPFGGLKQSGFGREGSMDELLSYTYTKSINIRLNSGKVPWREARALATV